MHPSSPQQAAEPAGLAAGCRVPGCHLAPAGPYFAKYRICRQHYSAAVLELGPGELHRFCQQCSRTHPLSEFDGSKLSCRAGLARHTQRRKERMQRQAGEPRKRRRLAAEYGAAQQGDPQARLLPGAGMHGSGIVQQGGPQARLLPGAGMHGSGGAALQQRPTALLASSHAQALWLPPAPSGPPAVLAVPPAAALPLPPALLPPQPPRAGRLLGPAAQGGREAASFLPPVLGPLTPTPSEDPPCAPAASALERRRLQLRCALRLRDRVQGLLQAMQRQQGPAPSPQAETREQPAPQPCAPVPGRAIVGGQRFCPSLRAGSCGGSTPSHVQQAAPRAGPLGASHGSAFRPWEARRQ